MEFTNLLAGKSLLLVVFLNVMLKLTDDLGSYAGCFSNDLIIVPEVLRAGANQLLHSVTSTIDLLNFEALDV